MTANERPLEVNVSESAENFETWINRGYISEATREELRKSDILIVPKERFGDQDLVYFPDKTQEILQFFKKKLPKNVNIDICIEEKDYKEVALHHDVVVIGCFLGTAVIVPVFVNILSEFIKRILFKEENTLIKFSFTKINADGSAKRLDFEGSAKDFNEAAEKLKEL
jgi:hypothetical protein